MNAEDVLKQLDLERQGGGFIPSIGPEKGKIVRDFLKEHGPKKVLEIGALYGYSAILIASQLSHEGRLITVEADPEHARITRKNITKAGLEDRIMVVEGLGKDVIPRLEGPFDMLFLDAAKEEYLDYLRLAEDKLSPGALIVADNAGIFAGEMKDYLEYVRNSGRYDSRTINVAGDAMEVSILRQTK